ncbi:MAG: isoleucine--tRNA ligase [Candidatus Pacebacteria bacterium]|nr:isoleucine--tRNA ligase [Candidatus Paceibacterota bacterium]
MNKEKNKEQDKTQIALREEKVLEFWNREKIFEKSVETPAGVENPEEFTFYDGPPFATGLPHYGHLLQSFVKDAVPRYKTMQGLRVRRQWGWDCHGLPIENIVEKELGISGREDIEKIGIKKFNDKCRSNIFEYLKVWEKVIPRIGRWVEMEHSYKTMDKNFMESEWWAFKQIFDKGLIYESHRIMHICPRCETTLSQSEVSEGYKDIKDLSVTAKFELVEEPGTFVLAWTTTPWTLPGNVALAVGADIDYVTIEKADDDSGKDVRFILAKKRLGHVFGESKYNVIKEYKGEELAGKAYKPLFGYYANDEALEDRENGWKIYTADFISDEDGTGIAHEAPAFGAEDMELAKEVGLPFVQHVDMAGNFKSEVKDFAGLNVKKKDDHQSADIEIIKHLAHNGLLFEKNKIEHSYPHCWRCDTPLLNYATSSWFVAVEKIKDDLIKYAKDINWSPGHIKPGRWGKWLEGARDWSISRNRFWANTMPVWRCDTCESQEVFGSIAELKDRSGVEVTDLHKDVVDEVHFDCKSDECKGKMSRIPDVLDTWFNSGSVPYAALHYPFENKEEFNKRVPADFIAEAQDQCRTWFYYQHVLSGSLFNKKAFKNVVTTGMVLAEDGKKMSKSLKNYPDPMYMIDKYGADAMRLYILSSPVVRAENLSFSEKEVAEISRKLFGRLINVYEFYDLYAGTLEHVDNAESNNVLDKWIIARLYKLHNEVTNAMENYELDKASRGLDDFVDDLSAWYLRRSRDRFKGEDEADKLAALQTTKFVLRKFAKLLAPFAPFHADWLWLKVKKDNDVRSVHLAGWCNKHDYDEGAIEEMVQVRGLITKALQARKDADINVRQPLESITLRHGELSTELKDVIADELNVKAVYFKPEAEYTVGLDTNITPELKEEGKLRDIIRGLQKARKAAGLKAGEYTSAKVSASKEQQNIINKFEADITKQTFINKFDLNDGEFTVEIV